MRPWIIQKGSGLTIAHLRATWTAKLSSSFFTYISFIWKDSQTSVQRGNSLYISTNTWIASSGLSCSDFYSVSGTCCGIAVTCIEICERSGRRALECGRSLAQKLLRTSPNTTFPCVLGNADTKKTKKRYECKHFGGHGARNLDWHILAHIDDYIYEMPVFMSLRLHTRRS